MNYKEYLSIKQSCGIKIRIYSVAVYLITLFAIAQAVISFARWDFSIEPINMYLLQVIYTGGYKYASNGNKAFSYLFYALYFAILLVFCVCSAFTFSSRRLPYGTVLALYGADAVLCLLVSNYYGFLLHFTLMVFVVLAFRNQTYLNMLKNNVWGYE